MRISFGKFELLDNKTKPWEEKMNRINAMCVLLVNWMKIIIFLLQINVNQYLVNTVSNGYAGLAINLFLYEGNYYCAHTDVIAIIRVFQSNKKLRILPV